MELRDIENLIDEYGDYIYRFCRKITINKDDSDDLYQQTFLKALEVRERIDKNNNPKSFLISIAINLWKNNMRKSYRQSRITRNISVNEEVNMDILDKSINVENEIVFKELECVVNKVISSIKDKYRIPIIMYYNAEMNIEEISKSLKIPKGTVKSRLYKGRNLIKVELEGLGYGEWE